MSWENAGEKEEPWWSKTPGVPDTADDLKLKPSSRECKEWALERRMELEESAKILEELMLQKQFQDGDQEKLAAAFACIDNDGSGKVNYEEFWDALSPICRNLREQDKQELFMKVDQECSGDLDLFAFLNFFLVTSHEQLQRPSTSKIDTHGKPPTNKGDSELQPFSPNAIVATPKTQAQKDLIIGIHHHCPSDQIVTISRDGSLFTWSHELKFQKSFRCNDPKVVPVKGQPNTPGLVVSSCCTPVTNLIGVSSMKRIIRFFDLSIEGKGSKEPNPLAFQYPPQPRPIMCLNVEAYERHGQEIFAHGCDQGHVTFQILKPNWHKVPISSGESSTSRETLTSQRFYAENPAVTFPAHRDWVTKAAYVEKINSIVSSSVDNVLSLYDLEAHKIKWSLDMSVKRGAYVEPAHTRGVRTWDWSRNYSMFATGGVEQTIQLWSPFVNKPVGSLDGGGSSILQVIFNDNDNQLLALEGTRKRVRVWDIRMQRCIGDVQDVLSADSGFISMMYHPRTQQIVVGGCRPQAYMKKGSSLVEKQYNYVAMAVCEVKNLVVAADEKNEIHLWRVGSGRHIFSFNANDDGSVTSLGFDHEHSRLLVGCNSGRIRLFNYGNGQLLKQYMMRGTPDVSCLCSVREHGEVLLYGATESAEVYLWKDTEEPTTQRPITYDRLNTSAHQLDISGLVYVPPDYLISCSFDGQLVVWQRGVPKITVKDPMCVHRPTMTRGMHTLCFLPLQKAITKTMSSAFSRRPSLGLESEHVLKFHVIVAAGTDGNMHFWNISTPENPTYLFALPVFAQTKGSFGIVQMCSDHTHSFLCCGDAHGVVKVNDISQMPSYDTLVAQGLPKSSCVITLRKFRAHSRALIAMRSVRLNNDKILGSAAIVTATLDELRIWTLEGELIGQFGREQWDLSVGIKTQMLDDDSILDAVDDDEDAGMSEVLSRLWISDTKVDKLTEASFSDEEIPEEVPSAELDAEEILQMSSVRFFKSDENPIASNRASLLGNVPKRMPRDWIRPKKFDSNLFHKVSVSELTDTSWTSAATKGGWSGKGIGRLPSTGSMPFSKNRQRMQTCIQELSKTPTEFRPGFIYDSKLMPPSTPETFGLSAASKRALRQPRSHSSML